MRFTTTFFAVVGAAALAGVSATSDHDQILAVIGVSAGMTALLWGLLVLASGGPRKFYAAERAWGDRPATPLPDLVPPVAVQTDQVLHVYRPSPGAYGRYVLPVARGGLVAAVPVLAYAVWALSNDGFSGLAVPLVLGSVAIAALVGGGWVALIFARSRVDIHPNGVTLTGAFRTVVLDNTTNSLIVRGEARSALHSLGSLWVNRATGQRCAVWEPVFDLPIGGLDPLLRGTVARSVIRQVPSRDVARYVSLGERRPMLPLAVILYLIVLLSTVIVLSSG